MTRRTVLCRIATWDFLGDSSFTDLYGVAHETQKAIKCNSTKSWNRGKMHPSQETSWAAQVKEDIHTGRAQTQCRLERGAKRRNRVVKKLILRLSDTVILPFPTLQEQPAYRGHPVTCCLSKSILLFSHICTLTPTRIIRIQALDALFSS